MALSRSPIKLAKKVSAIIGLRNAMSILFLERTSNTIKARSHPTYWKDHEKAVYVSVSQVLFYKRFEKIFSYLGLVSIPFRLITYL